MKSVLFSLLVTERRTSKTRLEFPYSRTLGPVVGAFMTGLREGKREFGQQIEARVTVIDRTGKVLAESDREP